MSCIWGTRRITPDVLLLIPGLQQLSLGSTRLCCCSGGVAAMSSKSGIGSGAIAGIVVGVAVAVVVAATAVVVYVKQKRSNKRSLLRMQSSGGFSRFEDF